jgi:hypothetical protein
MQMVVGVLLLVGAMLMSLLLRDNSYDGGATLTELSSDPLGVLTDRLLSGAETRPFDSLVLLNEMSSLGMVPLLSGRTYLSVPTWFLPGSIFPWKDGGANTWFTREFIPRFYYPDHIETSISAIGEAYSNFRFVGIVIAGCAVGVLGALLSRAAISRRPMGIALFCLITPLIFSLVRGDSFQNIPIVLIIGCIAYLNFRFVRDQPAAARPDASRVERSGSRLLESQYMSAR